MEKNMITIIDGVFSDIQMTQWKKNINRSTDNFVSGVLDKEGEGWYLVDADHDNQYMCYEILRLAGRYFKTGHVAGYDYWTHTSTRPMQWHYDKDETAYLKRGIKRYPVCSTVFYLEVENLIGGKLCFETGIEVVPKENRLVIFSEGLYHGVDEFEGVRTSININPWNSHLYK